MTRSENALLAALTDISGIGDARAHELYIHFEDPFNLLTAPPSLTKDYHYIDESTLTEIRSLDNAIDTYLDQFDTYESNGINIIGITDTQYPDAVRAGPAPVLLYTKGNTKLLTGDAVGVSGSRDTNESGQHWIESLSADLAETGYTIVSGGARGADTAAHRGALNTTNSTIAVLGTGVNVAYPPENHSLFDNIVDTGGLLISMRPPDAEPARHAFLDRNELIAALSDGMIFVATDGTGGTMAQYEMALKQDRPVFVPPSDLNIEPSDGLATIRESNDANLIQSTADISNGLPATTSHQKNLDEWG